VKRAFVDSGGFFALLVRTDAAHEGALRTFHQADVDRWQLVTTNTVIVETYALLLSRTRRGRDNAIAFLDRVERTVIRIERVTESDERKAMTLVRAHKDKMYSLCDAQSFVVMERLRIKQAIAADEDFRQYGFATLL
jgi:predicted nucleic acid-binding protein